MTSYRMILKLLPFSSIFLAKSTFIASNACVLRSSSFFTAPPRSEKWDPFYISIYKILIPSKYPFHLLVRYPEQHQFSLSNAHYGNSKDQAALVTIYTEMNITYPHHIHISPSLPCAAPFPFLWQCFAITPCWLVPYQIHVSKLHPGDSLVSFTLSAAFFKTVCLAFSLS